MFQPPTIQECIGQTPLVRLTRLQQGLKRPIWAKCEYLNPGGSVKDRIALSIIEQAERQQQAQPGCTFIEATAGNTGLGLALLCAQRGYHLVCVMPEKMSEDKRNCLRLAGAQVIVVPNAPLDSPDNFQQVARRMASDNGWILADQFCNPANIAAHYGGTGPEIWQQTKGQLTSFVCGVGTGGSITGIGRFLKEKNSNIEIVLADPVGSALADFVEHQEFRTDAAYRVEGIGASRPAQNFQLSVVDRVERISDEESFQCQQQLIRQEGLFVGGSAGTIMAAALRVAAQGQGPVVCLLPDSWDRYWLKMVQDPIFLRIKDFS